MCIRDSHMYEGQLKAVSFLPMSNSTYPQQPYTQITKEQYEGYIGKIKTIDFNAIYDGVEGLEAIGESYCTTDACELKEMKTSDLASIDDVLV